MTEHLSAGVKYAAFEYYSGSLITIASSSVDTSLSIKIMEGYTNGYDCYQAICAEDSATGEVRFGQIYFCYTDTNPEFSFYKFNNGNTLKCAGASMINTNPLFSVLISDETSGELILVSQNLGYMQTNIDV